MTVTLEQAEASAMRLLRHWQRRKTRPISTDPKHGICRGWYLVMPKGVVGALLAAGTWKISEIEVPSANGRKMLRMKTFHPAS